MSIRLKCRCGRSLQLKDELAGKRIRCPECEDVLDVPDAEPEVLSDPEVLDDSDPFEEVERRPKPQRRQTPPGRRRAASSERKRRSAGPRVPRGLVVGVSGVVAVGLIVLLVINLMSPSGNDVDANFTPLAAADVESAGEPMIVKAREFVTHARNRDSGAALKMIDRELFGERQQGPDGSYEAVHDELKASEVLTHIARYALESTSGHGGKRLWQILGTSEFAGLDGVLVRYYSEPRGAHEFVEDREFFARMADLISYEEFEQTAGDLFAFQQLKKTRYNTRRSSKPDCLEVLPPRVGYAMLVFQEHNGESRLCDLVNVLGQQPLSRSGGAAFRKDWNVTHFGGPSTKGDRSEKVKLCMFGDLPSRLLAVPNPGMVFDARNVAYSPDMAKKYFSENQDVRAVRLGEVAWELFLGSDQLSDRVEQFRTDYDGDSGADMAVVVMTMLRDEPEFSKTRGAQVIASASRLHESLRDPFLLSVQGLAHAAAENHADARRCFTEAQEAGYESVDLHTFFVRDAVRQQDKTKLLEALRGLSRYWGTAGAARQDNLLAQQKSRWERHERDKQPKTSVADAMRGNRPGMDAQGGGGSRPGFGGGFPRGRFGGGPPFGPGGQRMPNTRPPRGNNRPQPPAQNGPVVTIKITAKSSFDTQKIMRALQAKGIRNMGVSRSNNRGSVTIRDQKTVDEVVAAIDFGTVGKVDREARTIEVTFDE